LFDTGQGGDRPAFRMAIIETHSDARASKGVGVIDVAAYLAVLGISAALLQRGGAVAIAAAAIGAAIGFSRRDCRTWSEKLRAAWEASFAALWAGLMVGGLALNL
jgi:hypothetical protein